MPAQRVYILICRPDGTLVAQYLLGDGEHLIGRNIDCPIYLDSEYISSNHAKLYLSHDGIQIEDLNSTSGTFLDGVTVRGKLRIKPGQVLQVADLTVQLQPESEGQIGPGSRLGDGRYTLIRLLGRGGMGEVWLAKDEQLDEEVAIKKLPPEVGADAMALADMRREVQKSRALSHPNIVRIHDLIQKSGEAPLISLEFVDGTDLTAIAATKPNGIFGWAEIKDWIVQLVNALEYAHEEKIIHRDLKPSNIMINRDGRLKLADFGIAATLADSMSRSSMEGLVSGTTLYMSPQQMEGTAPKVTDDVYAFGATLYDLLTSKPPFYTGNVEHQVLHVTPMPIAQRLIDFGFVSEIPQYVNDLVMASLAKDPAGRPKNMTAIRDWIQSEGTAMGAIPKPSTKTYKKHAPGGVAKAEGETPQDDSKNRLAYAIGAGAILICLVIGIILARSDKPNGPHPNTDANQARSGTDLSSNSNGPFATTTHSLTRGLVAYYPFNGNANDESNNSNHANVFGPTLTTDRHGSIKRAYSFDGKDDYLIVPHHSSLNIPGGLTLSVWVRADSIAGFAHIFSKGDGLSNNQDFLVQRDGAKFLYFWRSKQSSPETWGKATTSEAVFAPGQWVHILVTHLSGNGPVLYINGIQQVAVFKGVPTNDPTVPRNFYKADMKIGVDARSTGNAYLFNGKLDDIRIYNRLLTEAEVKALYDLEKPPQPIRRPPPPDGGQ